MFKERKVYLKRLITILLTITFIFPIIILVCYALCLNWAYPNLIPNNITTRGINALLSTESLSITFNSIGCALLVTLFTVLLCIPAARALSQEEFKGKSFFTLLITSPLILPLTSITMGLHILFIKLGLTNTILGVTLINTIPCIPYGVRLISNVMSIVGKKHEVAAKSLGASSIKAFFYITFPMILPGIISSCAFVFIIAFSQYFTTFLIGGGLIKTLPMVLIPYIQSGDRTLASVYSILFIASSLLVLIVLEKIVSIHYKKSFYL